jgi:hypothetical protein
VRFHAIPVFYQELFLDLNKLNGIASKNKWVQSDWDLKILPQDK